MQTPFGFSWDDLDEDAIAQFFADAPKDEGLTWEAKGDDDRGAFSRDGFREAVAGLANGTLVGYVVVGAEWQRPEGPGGWWGFTDRRPMSCRRGWIS